MSQQFFESAPVSRSEVASLMLQVVDVLNAIREDQAELSMRVDADRDPDLLRIEGRIEALLDRVESFMQKFV